MNDYKETMQKILLEYYSNTPEGSKIQMQTSAVLSWFKGVIPSQPVNEHDVFEVLTDLGFKHSQKIIYEKNVIKKATKWEEEISEEIEVGRILVWNLYERI
ncbi:hypothetical protein AB670_02572 [Chryseobacterium sp. MOF25P]|uniref:hypothetical protein n=1 Tax=unclassified Chryseobacterium TaxID=2593645 RepID=UPI000804FCBC|nr:MULTISPECIES: hypothetical protein [unclassified Chryseobacterium]MBO6183629.1 hypothetical protein [Chryseobacterium sp.]OBW41121.1 hypothetical protein AB670_02572 [Chryseobacterium sp. MOF25P]OBW45749.1 hypothetical protein AB671_02157 [Chryseobacterium sp. BGARF1]